MENVHVTFVHGLANKPPPAELRRIWLEALHAPVPGDDGFDLGAAGVSDSFVYWVVDCPPVDGFMTIDSPLGVDEVQDRQVWSRDNGFPATLRGDWVNVLDPLDLVSRLDPRLANDFRKSGEAVVIDIQEENWGTWRHSATKYLKGRKLREHLRRLCDREGA